jgi:exodeoxyribonuclease V alpha subunit
MTATCNTITTTGHLERITYYNPDNHYAIAVLKTGHPKTRITIVGYMTGLCPGQSLKVTGRWETHPKYGQQLSVVSVDILVPDTVEGLLQYFRSGLIKGIGDKTAAVLIRHFKEQTIDIIENHPERLTEVNGIGKAKAALIRREWTARHINRRLMRFLQDHGINLAYSAKLLKQYGDRVIDVLENEPFRVSTDLPEIGFLIADTISRNCGLPPDDPHRIRACLLHLIEREVARGHVCVFAKMLFQQCFDLFEIDFTDAKAAAARLAQENEIVIEKAPDGRHKNLVYPKRLHQAETGIALKLKAMLTLPVNVPNIDVREITDQVVRHLAIEPSREQLAILKKMLAQRIAIITGGPGTGKTTMIRAVTAIFQALGIKILLAAPTGRAARRLAQVSHRKAVTLHKLLGYNVTEGIFIRNQDHPIEADAVIVDEASMIDTFLMYHLLCATPVQALLILVGDVFQLPSVGPGNILSDLIRSDVIPSYTLTRIFRQEQKSPIVVGAHKIHQGELPDIDAEKDSENHAEFEFVEVDDPQKAVDIIVDFCRRRIPARHQLDSLKDVQVITPMHKGEVGTINLNRSLQQALNPKLPGTKAYGIVFRRGDKVMHLKNNYQKEVFNGDIGLIHTINGRANRLQVDYDGRIVDYAFNELDELSLAYAISVHKSQGSEYPAVIIPLMTQHFALLQRNLLYTAVTRGKKLVILVGMKRALAIALKNDTPLKRLSLLAQRLNEDLYLG